MSEHTIDTRIFKSKRKVDMRRDNWPWIVEMVEQPSGDILVVDTETYEEASFLANTLYQLALYFRCNTEAPHPLRSTYLMYAEGSRGDHLMRPVNFKHLTLHVDNNLRYSYINGSTEIEEFTDAQD